MREIFSGGKWTAGTELGSAVPSAESSAMGRYTLFLGVCDGKPVLLMGLGNSIWGEGVKITREGQVVTLAEATSPVTALYALL